jgi:hypothetical protein
MGPKGQQYNLIKFDRWFDAVDRQRRGSIDLIQMPGLAIFLLQKGEAKNNKISAGASPKQIKY